MAAENSSTSTGTATSGGMVQPTNRAAVERARRPPDAPGERYELRDPFADVTYRSTSFRDIAAKAHEMGSSRLTAIAVDGKRTPIQNVEGEWRRDEQIAARPDRPLDPDPAAATDRNAVPLSSTLPTKGPSQAPAKDPKTEAKIEMQADQAALISRLEEALRDRYIIKRAPVAIGDLKVGHTEYRFRGDTSRIAFTESTVKLATDTNSPSVARSMVDVAQARSWNGLRISGSEEFKRLVWLEATARGVKAVGYEPTLGDIDTLKREQQARLTNGIEQTHGTGTRTVSNAPEKVSARGSGGRKAVLTAIEAVLVSKGIPEAKRSAVLAAATEKLAQRASRGQMTRVKVYDPTALPQRPAANVAPEVTRSRDRAAPAPTR